MKASSAGISSRLTPATARAARFCKIPGCDTLSFLVHNIFSIHILNVALLTIIFYRPRKRHTVDFNIVLNAHKINLKLRYTNLSTVSVCTMTTLLWLPQPPSERDTELFVPRIVSPALSVVDPLISVKIRQCLLSRTAINNLYLEWNRL